MSFFNQNIFTTAVFLFQYPADRHFEYLLRPRVTHYTTDINSIPFSEKKLILASKSFRFSLLVSDGSPLFEY